MSQTNFTFPGGNTGYVPQLHENLIIEYSRNPQAFPLNRYINLRKVEKMRGYYVNMKNDGQGRVVNTTDIVWPDGNDQPETIYGNDQFDFPPYECVRTAITKRLGFLGVEQGAWDLLDQASRMMAQDLMTFRTYQVLNTLTTAGNWGSNTASSTTLAGGTWANATDTAPYIRSSLMAAAITIQKSTYSTVQLSDLYLVINPSLARTIAISQEFISFLKQNPVALSIWQGQDQFAKYNIPQQMFGINVIVEDTVYNAAGPNAVTSGKTGSPISDFNFCLPQVSSSEVALLLTKQQAIQPAAGGGFSTYELFTYQDLETFVYTDQRNKRYELRIEQNIDTSVNSLVAPASGFLITGCT